MLINSLQVKNIVGCKCISRTKAAEILAQDTAHSRVPAASPRDGVEWSYSLKDQDLMFLTQKEIKFSLRSTNSTAWVSLSHHCKIELSQKWKHHMLGPCTWAALSVLLSFSSTSLPTPVTISKAAGSSLRRQHQMSARTDSTAELRMPQSLGSRCMHSMKLKNAAGIRLSALQSALGTFLLYTPALP